MASSPAAASASAAKSSAPGPVPPARRTISASPEARAARRLSRSRSMRRSSLTTPPSRSIKPRRSGPSTSARSFPDAHHRAVPDRGLPSKTLTLGLRITGRCLTPAAASSPISGGPSRRPGASSIAPRAAWLPARSMRPPADGRFDDLAVAGRRIQRNMVERQNGIGAAGQAIARVDPDRSRAPAAIRRAMPIGSSKDCSCWRRGSRLP